jgi:DNA-binding MarR family transcriptional regulator
VPPTKADFDLAAALSALHREMDALYGVIARRFGLTAQQVELLCQLDKRTPSLGELAAELGCDKTNITGMIDRLERRGLLRREPDPADRRVSRVTLTEEGAALGPKIRAAVAEATARGCRALPAADRSRLTNLMQAAFRALHAERVTGQA